MHMRPFLVCDRHREPMRFPSKTLYEEHMKREHRKMYFEILQTERDYRALKRLDEDPYDEYYRK